MTLKLGSDDSESPWIISSKFTKLISKGFTRKDVYQAGLTAGGKGVCESDDPSLVPRTHVKVKREK